MENNTDQELIEVIMNIIINAGNAKSDAINAIRAAKEFNFELAEEKLKLAKDSELLAHNAQTKLLARESDGQRIELSLLIVHAQDHLMNCITFNDLAREIIDLYKTIKNNK
ncbi:MAG: PTS lactose/cellobiose transporter subunit IIA [Tissierellaceae bacterium]|jgi:PTS system cellobiose-specific IIA component